jgi:hypothetical protein
MFSTDNWQNAFVISSSFLFEKFLSVHYWQVSKVLSVPLMSESSMGVWAVKLNLARPWPSTSRTFRRRLFVYKGGSFSQKIESANPAQLS